MVNYNNKKYYIDVLEAKPTDKICLIDTDCEVDFAPPLDYEEPTPDFSNASASAPAASAAPSLFGRPPAKEKEAPPPEPEAPKFAAFGGAARRLVCAPTCHAHTPRGSSIQRPHLYSPSPLGGCCPHPHTHTHTHTQRLTRQLAHLKQGWTFSWGGAQDGKAAVAGSSLSAAGSGSSAVASSSSSGGGGGGGEAKEGEVAGKMVFGGTAAARKPGEPLVKKLVKKKKEKKEEDKPPEPKFIPFQGSGNKLK